MLPLNDMAFNEKIQLRWEDSKETLNLSSVFQSFREEEELLDVSLVCSQTNGGSVAFRCHKLVLAAYSPLFKSIFARSNGKQEPLVFLKGISQDNLSLILDFVYNGSVEVPKSSISEFFSDAKDLQIKGLEEFNQIDNGKSTSNQVPLLNENKLMEPKVLSKKDRNKSLRENVIYLQDISDSFNSIARSSIEHLGRDLNEAPKEEDAHVLTKTKKFKSTQSLFDAPAPLIEDETDLISVNESELNDYMDNNENVNLIDGTRLKCEKCEDTFSRIANLRQHTKTVHDKIKDFYCNYCNYSTGVKGTLMLHTKRRHFKRKKNTVVWKDGQLVWA